MKKVKYRIVGDGYEAVGSYTYYSPRYGKSITIKDGFFSDGATAVPDIDSDSWWVHDHICRYGVWDDGTQVSKWQASMVLHDILVSEGHHFLGDLGKIGTFVFGGGVTRENDRQKLQE